MRLLRDYNACPRSTRVAVLGAFDGLHLGHRALLQAAREESRTVQRQCETAVSVVCFEPLPRQYFGGADTVARLVTPSERLHLLVSEGIQQTWQLRFNSRLAATSAEDFVQRVIVDGLRAGVVVVGEDFRFGAARRGDVSLLRQMGVDAGFRVRTVAPVLHRSERISSTRIRAALAAGELDEAAAMLGRPFSMRGRVRNGQRLGRTLGYPTANLALPGRVSPLEGIFAVRVLIDAPPVKTYVDAVQSHAGFDGVASLGRRPTVGAGDPLLEVHLFDFDGDLYHRHLQVFFIQKLRDEAHFSSIDAMVAQIHDDAAQARRILQQG